MPQGCSTLEASFATAQVKRSAKYFFVLTCDVKRQDQAIGAKRAEFAFLDLATTIHEQSSAATRSTCHAPAAAARTTHPVCSIRQSPVSDKDPPPPTYNKNPSTVSRYVFPLSEFGVSLFCCSAVTLS